MTPILTKYFFRRNAFAITTVWLALTMLFVLFDILQKADDQGFIRTLLIAVFRSPTTAIYVLPFACTIGAVIAIRQMITAGEMTALRVAGLSPAQLCKLNIAVIILVVVAYAFLSEVLIPTGAKYADALEGKQNTTRKIWLKDGENYILVNRLHTNGRMEDLVIYHTRNFALHAVTAAESAMRYNDTWRLHNPQTQYINPADATTPPTWTLSLDLSSFSVFFKKPRNLALSAVTQAAVELPRSGQYLHDVWEELWLRLELLISLPLFVIIGVLFVSDDRRRRTTSIAIITAALLPGIYLLCTKIVIQSSAIFNALWLLPLPPCLLIWVLWRKIYRPQPFKSAAD